MFNGRTVPVSVIFIVITALFAAGFSRTISAEPFTSALITQIGFNPLNQPASFIAGVSNPASQPLRIQTQRADGIGENVTGSGQTVFLQMTTSSPTGRFDLSPSGAFSTSTLVLTVTNGRQNSQDFFYRDPTPGVVILTARVTTVANTGLSLGETASVTKTVFGNGGTRLTFGTQPSSVNKDEAIAPPITVRVEDDAGNLDVASTRSVTVAIGTNPGGGTLNGTSTVAAVGGIATFDGLSIDKAGNGYTLVATSALPDPALTAGISTTFDVNQAEQTIEFGELEDKIYGDLDFEIKASATSGLEVIFTSLTPEVCFVQGAIVQVFGAGQCTIRASQDGDVDHHAASDTDRSFEVLKANATIIVTPYDVTYDGLPHTANLIAMIGVNGESGSIVGTIDLSGTVHTNAGAYSNDHWNFAGTANYNDTSGIAENNISKAPTVTTVLFESGPYVYRGSAYTAIARVTGPGSLDQIVTTTNYFGDCLNVTTTNGCTASAFYPESANHLQSSGFASVTIEKKALTVAASSHSVVFGSPIPTVSPIFDGFVPGDNSSVIGSSPSCSTTYAVGSPVGIYATECSGGTDKNYDFVSPYLEGTVTVTTVCSAFNGFLAPVGGANEFPILNGPGGSFLEPIRSFKLNSTIPFKFAATCFGIPLSDGVQMLSARKYDNGIPSGKSISGGRFRLTGNHWHLNFDTKLLSSAGPGTWLFEATLMDGSKYSVWLAIR